MNNYSNNNRGGRNDSRGSSRSSFSNRDSGQTQMHDAVCGDCHGNCKVPFMPSSGKPVYCSNCFEKRGNGRDDSRGSNRSNSSYSGGRDNSRSSAPRQSDNNKSQFDKLNQKLDIILKLLSKEENQE